jgi:hypothetical protein
MEQGKQTNAARSGSGADAMQQELLLHSVWRAQTRKKDERTGESRAPRELRAVQTLTKEKQTRPASLQKDSTPNAAIKGRSERQY